METLDVKTLISALAAAHLVITWAVGILSIVILTCNSKTIPDVAKLMIVIYGVWLAFLIPPLSVFFGTFGLALFTTKLEMRKRKSGK